MRRVIRAGLLAGGLVLSMAAVARADDRATREAQARFVEGLARVKSGDFDAARMSFTQAYAVLHKPDILWNLALSEQKSGHFVEALGHFRQLERDAATTADRTRAGKHVTELMAATAHVEVAAPAGSQVSVDGAAVGTAPLVDPIDVTAGPHHIEVRTAQGATKSADADAVVGTVARVSFLQGDASPAPAVAPTPTPAPAAAGGPSPTEAQPPSPQPGTGEPPPVTMTHGTFWDARGITVVVAGSAAIVAGGLGIAFATVSSNDASTASTLRQQNPSCTTASQSAGCAQLASTTDSQHGAYVASRGLWATAGILAVGAVCTYFFWPRTPAGATSSVQVAPTVGAGGAGVAPYLAIGRAMDQAKAAGKRVRVRERQRAGQREPGGRDLARRRGGMGDSVRRRHRRTTRRRSSPRWLASRTGRWRWSCCSSSFVRRSSRNWRRR